MTRTEKAEKLAKLKEELKELQKHAPSHCSGTKSFVDHNNVSPALFEKIENLEEEIDKLEGELK